MIGKKSNIVLISNYIIDKLNPDEIVCLVAAELAQVQHKHRLLSLITSSLMSGESLNFVTARINNPPMAAVRTPTFKNQATKGLPSITGIWETMT